MAELGRNAFRLEVVTPQRPLVSDEVNELVAPGSDGYFGVLPGHLPFLTTLKVGELTYRVGRDEHHMAVSGGYAEVRPDRVVVLADMAERAEEIDVEGAEADRRRAEEQLRRVGDPSVDFASAQAELERAATRLAVAAKGR